jgi:hypothetical protein
MPDGHPETGSLARRQARWFERLLSELQFELWIGDAAETSSKRGAPAEDGSPGFAADSLILRLAAER